MRAENAVAEGAEILDVGGESSRPGASPVSVNEEIDRVMPVVEALVRLGVPISVDTTKPQVMKAALSAGADMINDIGGFSAEGAVEAVADSSVALCIMHMQGEPRTMQQTPHYGDVVSEVRNYLLDRAQSLQAAGVAADRICLDPGFGFGKTLQHNLSLLRQLGNLCGCSYPVLAGLSRKSMLGSITGRAPAQRVVASAAAALLAAQGGARILRVHDVAATRDALLVWQAYADCA